MAESYRIIPDSRRVETEVDIRKGSGSGTFIL